MRGNRYVPDLCAFSLAGESAPYELHYCRRLTKLEPKTNLKLKPEAKPKAKPKPKPKLKLRICCSLSLSQSLSLSY